MSQIRREKTPNSFVFHDHTLPVERTVIVFGLNYLPVTFRHSIYYDGNSCLV